MTNSGIRFLALGNGVWLDEIRNEDAEPIRDVPGGSVMFAALGARLFTSKQPESIAMIFNVGYDFTESVIDTLRSWSIELDVRRLPDKPSARGLVFYTRANSNRKAFQRLTEPLPVTIEDLYSSSNIRSNAYHFFGTAEYIREQVQNIVEDRAEGTAPTPFIVWEPHAKSCLSATLQSHKHAATLVDVFSPNHEELGSFFDGPNQDFASDCIEGQAEVFVRAGIGKSGCGCIIVRAAGYGCLVMSRSRKPVWLPPVHDQDCSKVVDPTGAGNAFLGAFVVGWQDTGDFVEAAKYGQVAASLVIEQVGLPSLLGNGETERWNDANAVERLHEYQRRTSGL